MKTYTFKIIDIHREERQVEVEWERGLITTAIDLPSTMDENTTTEELIEFIKSFAPDKAIEKKLMATQQPDQFPTNAVNPILNVETQITIWNPSSSESNTLENSQEAENGEIEL